MPKPLKLSIEVMPYNDIDELFRLAMEQPIFFLETSNCETIHVNYTLKELTSMPFEEWAYLIEIENENEKFLNFIDGYENEISKNIRRKIESLNEFDIPTLLPSETSGFRNAAIFIPKL